MVQDEYRDFGKSKTGDVADRCDHDNLCLRSVRAVIQRAENSHQSEVLVTFERPVHPISIEEYLLLCRLDTDATYISQACTPAALIIQLSANVSNFNKIRRLAYRVECLV